MVLVGKGRMTFHGVRFTDWFSFYRMRLEAKQYPGDEKPAIARMWFTNTVFAGQSTSFERVDITRGTISLGSAQLLSGVTFAGVEGAENVSCNQQTGYRLEGVEWGPVDPGPAQLLPAPLGTIRRAFEWFLRR